MLILMSLCLKLPALIQMFCLKNANISLCAPSVSAWCPLTVLWHVLKSLFSTSQGVNWYLVSAMESGELGGGGAEVYRNREAVRISPEKAGGTLGRKKWKWEEMKKKVGENGRERWGVDFFPNLAQGEAIFLVLLCQINAAFQIFISELRRRGYCVHYRGEKTEKHFHC